MGVLALFVLWGNTLLVLLAAVRNLGELAAHVRGVSEVKLGSLPPGDHLVLFRAEAPQGVAFHVLEQLGRLAAGVRRAVVWHHKGAISRLQAGTLSSDGVLVQCPSTNNAAVWPDSTRLREAVACPNSSEFEEAVLQARKPKGYLRPVELEVSGPVFVVGTVRVSDGPTKQYALVDTGAPTIVSVADPRTLVRQRTAIVWLLFVPVLLVVAGGCTVLALSTPVFESWQSKLGGLLGLIYFLLVIGAGTRLRDFLLPPHRQLIRGAWSDPR
jgi:hypothetical protein